MARKHLLPPPRFRLKRKLQQRLRRQRRSRRALPLPLLWAARA